MRPWELPSGCAPRAVPLGLSSELLLLSRLVTSGQGEFWLRPAGSTWKYSFPFPKNAAPVSPPCSHCLSSALMDPRVASGGLGDTFIVLLGFSPQNLPVWDYLVICSAQGFHGSSPIFCPTCQIGWVLCHVNPICLIPPACGVSPYSHPNELHPHTWRDSCAFPD